MKLIKKENIAEAPKVKTELGEDANLKNLMLNLTKEKGWVVFATRLHEDDNGNDRLSSHMVVSSNYKPADLEIAIKEYEKMIKGEIERRNQENV